MQVNAAQYIDPWQPPLLLSLSRKLKQSSVAVVNQIPFVPHTLVSKEVIPGFELFSIKTETFFNEEFEQINLQRSSE